MREENRLPRDIKGMIDDMKDCGVNVEYLEEQNTIHIHGETSMRTPIDLNIKVVSDLTPERLAENISRANKGFNVEEQLEACKQLYPAVSEALAKNDIEEVKDYLNTLDKTAENCKEQDYSQVH